MYGGKKVPGMFEDDRMMYGGMKKKRMQRGEEVGTTPEVPERRKDREDNSEQLTRSRC